MYVLYINVYMRVCAGACVHMETGGLQRVFSLLACHLIYTAISY